MAKKQKKAAPEHVQTKHQLSKWQRQMKIRRIVIIAAVVFLVGISSWIGYGFYKDYKNDPLRQVAIKVNDVPLNMEYFVDVLDLLYMNLTGGNSTELYYYADYFTGMAADQIINAELVTQGAKNLNIAVTSDEIDEALQQYGLADEAVYRDLVGAGLLEEKIREHFDPGENATMEQADAQVMLLESQEVANDVTAKIEAGGNFTALAEEFSCNSSVERDLGWLPEELMPNTAIANAAFNLTPGDTSQPVYDATVTKDIGYWLIEVTAAENETIDAQVMLLGSEAEAERIKAELAAGGNFSALAGNYSQHESKTNGGMLDGLAAGDMGSTAFDQVAFSIALNQVSDPVKDESVQTTGGYWIVKVLDKGDHQIDEQIRQQLIDKRYNDWLEARRNSSTIDNLLDDDKNAWAIDEVFRREGQ